MRGGRDLQDNTDSNDNNLSLRESQSDRSNPLSQKDEFARKTNLS